VVANPNNTNALKTLKENHAQSTYAQQADLVMAKQAVSQKNYQDALNYLLPLTNSTNKVDLPTFGRPTREITDIAKDA
jgi:predicted negative regulator of RcsB-dependent stress response